MKRVSNALYAACNVYMYAACNVYMYAACNVYMYAACNVHVCRKSCTLNSNIDQ